MKCQVEYLLEKAMKDFDETSARKLIGFIIGGIYEENEYICHYMRTINKDFVMQGCEKELLENFLYC